MAGRKRAVSNASIDLPVYRRGPELGAETLAQHEWLLTNGIGGYAMGTPLGTLARRYHGLLVAALTPPVGRVVALSSMAERVVGVRDEAKSRGDGAERSEASGEGGERSGEGGDLAAFRWAGTPFDPPGFAHFDGFDKDVGAGSCRWRWRVGGGSGGSIGNRGDVILQRELTLVEGENAATIRYSALGGPVRLLARPLVALRDFHCVLREHDDPQRFHVKAIDGGAQVEAHGMRLTLRAQGARFRPEPDWWRNFFHQRDSDRGLEAVEDLFCPGVFEMNLAEKAGTATISAWLGDQPISPLPRRAQRVRSLAAAALTHAEANASGPIPDPDRTAIAAMAASSDDFVVRRGRDRSADASIIAGYPWFSDWGRDTMICLPGLLLVTGRHDDAFRTLRGFARHRRNGIIPNRFDDSSGGAHYNTVDASLWFLHACCEYVRATGDRGAFLGELYPACREVIDAYTRGTDYNIRLDDSLITAGDEHTQLTWMDARHNDTVFTPRHGKCVEINALWFNGLMSLADILASADKIQEARPLRAAARQCEQAFEAFWRPTRDGGGHLYDRLARNHDGAWIPVDEMRPNQVLAASLPHSPLNKDRARAVIHTVKRRLLTPHGLRTLDPAHPNYRPRFTGPLPQLDAAYHNGTVWPWLLGPLAEAILRADSFSPAAKREARALIRPIITRMDAAPAGAERTRETAGGECPGHIAEVFDAEDTHANPQQPGGCPAQAWSLAEALRISVLAS